MARGGTLLLLEQVVLLRAEKGEMDKIVRKGRTGGKVKMILDRELALQVGRQEHKTASPASAVARSC
jgi:hypothetical protein